MNIDEVLDLGIWGKHRPSDYHTFGPEGLCDKCGMHKQMLWIGGDFWLCTEARNTIDIECEVIAPQAVEHR